MLIRLCPQKKIDQTLASLETGLGKAHSQIPVHLAEHQTEAASAPDVEDLTTSPKLAAIAQVVALATSKAMGKFETLATGTAKAHLLLHYNQLLQPRALTVLAAVMDLQFEETHPRGAKGDPMQDHGLRGASS